MAIKSRSYLVKDEHGYARLDDGAQYNATWVYQSYNTETTESFAHKHFANGTWDSGGPFLNEKTTYLWPPSSEIACQWKPDVPITSRVARMSGTLLPAYLPSMPAPPLPPIVVGDLDASGTHAIARVAPTNPNSSLLVTLGEIKRDGIPYITGSHLLKEKVAHFKSLGDEYLNVQFGWKPFMSDLRKFGGSVINHNKLMEDFAANAGKNVHRSYRFSPVSTTVTTDLGLQYPGNSLGVGGEQPFFTNGDPRANLIQTDLQFEDRWFEGCFTYAFPVGDSALEKLQRATAGANHLFGVGMTPENLWNLQPWTWAIDWVGNIGEILHNISLFSQDGLVMRYGFMMQHLRYIRTYSMPDSTFKGATPTFSIISERKRRVPATPYGFGLSWDGFSPTQWSILAALGITHGQARHS